MLSCQRNEKTVLSKDQLHFIEGQLENTLADAKDPFLIPRTIKKDGTLITVNIYDWTSGFFAGNLWYMYELTINNKWKIEAEKWTEVDSQNKHVTSVSYLYH